MKIQVLVGYKTSEMQSFHMLCSKCYTATCAQTRCLARVQDAWYHTQLYFTKLAAKHRKHRKQTNSKTQQKSKQTKYATSMSIINLKISFFKPPNDHCLIINKKRM